MIAALGGHGGRNSIGGRQEVHLADRVGTSWRGRSVGRTAGQWQTATALDIPHLIHTTLVMVLITPVAQPPLGTVDVDVL